MLAFTTAALALSRTTSTAGSESDFRSRVVPVLKQHCVRCHQGPKPKGSLDLTSAKGLAAGADGAPVVVPGKPRESRLIEVVSGDRPEMPKTGKPLAASEIQVLRAWIAAGAEWPASVVIKDDPLDWWSLRPVVKPRIPATSDASAGFPRTPIDAFVLAGLGSAGLRPSPEADRRTLIRRLSYDLLGLPPEADEVEAFVADTDPLAYEKLVDRLLASPHYGERWARHWLDVVHYGETHGYDKDKPRPHAWPYRDYLIRAFNEDRPYAQFVEEQLAGDALEPDSRDGIEATGFLAAGPWDFIGHAEVPETKIDGQIARNLDRDDMVTTTLNTFCSVTGQCARCHDHKFDPVTREHYYSLQAVFAAIDRADRSYDADPQVARRRRELEARLRAIEPQPKPHEESVQTPPLGVVAERSALFAALAALPKQSVVYCGTVYSGSGAFRGTGGKPRAIHVLERGDVRHPGKLVGPGALPFIKDASWQFELPAGAGEGERRIALAHWITDRRNPLTWRSIVNRVWLYHFGRGIVDSPSDFGRMGQLPTHPELLDWLAVDLRDGSQSLKRLHRMIVTSAAYRQASTSTAAAAQVDAGNSWLWRMNRSRLDAESIRDSVLSASGCLDARLFGPSFQTFVVEKPEHSPHYEYDKADPDDRRAHRRSVYRFLVRSQPDPFEQALDCADPSQIIDKRDESITALQALALLNDRFMIRMAEHLAERVRARRADLEGQVAEAVRLTLQRPSTASESKRLVPFAREFGLAETCRLLFNLNEFVYVD
ncbi:MAG TPA: PSD1 and planctomycete cytochrome C domain-containing protein [Planctomycetaceae bacterium]|nr:PSD1 and planctomycete cytochrome C domain-containing protein [Planctomycetaceae bacterium]